MDDDGDDDDDDCGYLPKRQDRRERERERPSCLPCLVFVQTGVRSWTTEKDANNTLLRGGIFFSIQRRRQGILRGGNLTFFYIFRECTLTTYLPTLCKRERNPWRQHEIYHNRLPILFFSLSLCVHKR